MKKKYQSEALMVCHQSAEYLFKVGLMSADEMREFDEDCLVQEPESVYNAKNPIETEQIIA
jgi:DNA-binding transcriptional regulator YiaG